LIAKHERAIAATDGIVTIASRIAQGLAADYHPQELPPPIVLDSFEITMAWRSAPTNDPAIQWLRIQLLTISNQI
jgi:DNA-binding transcriptional LysR family regulator